MVQIVAHNSKQEGARDVILAERLTYIPRNWLQRSFKWLCQMIIHVLLIQRRMNTTYIYGADGTRNWSNVSDCLCDWWAKYSCEATANGLTANSTQRDALQHGIRSLLLLRISRWRRWRLRWLYWHVVFCSDDSEACRPLQYGTKTLSLSSFTAVKLQIWLDLWQHDI